MGKLILGLGLTANLFAAQWALAEVIPNENMKELIPPEYYNLPVVVLDSQLTRPGESEIVSKAKCRNAKRIGAGLGKKFAQQLQPSCDQLMMPLFEGEAMEWAIPRFEFSESTDIATVCSYVGYANAFEETVLNTVQNCSIMLDQAVKVEQQLAYDSCYKEVAGMAIELGTSFGSVSGLVTEGYVVVPRDSAAWDDFVAGFMTVLKDGKWERSPLMQASCQLGTSHAARKTPPIRFFESE